MTKVVIVGAGSLVFSSRLTADLLTFDATRDAHFALVDIDPERLAFAGRIVERIFKEGGYESASYSATTDLREALDGADHVIISILVGGYEAIESEIDIPMKYGVDQSIGDTFTPGGVMRCLRTLPVLNGIMEDIRDICPQATVLNYTNPMGMLMRGMYEHAPEIAMVGLCHSVQGTTREWADRLDIPIAEVNFECAGINHQAWITRFERDGEDLLPKMRELAVSPGVWNGDSARMEYCKHFGYPVTESSAHVSEYNPWFRKNAETIAAYCAGDSWNGASGFIKSMYRRPDWKESMEKMANWEKPVSLERSLEYGAHIINAIEGGNPVVIHGNVRNDGLIDNLPEGSCVEVPCYVDKNGMRPMKVGALPPHLAAINRTQLSVQELAVRAAQTSDPELVFQAMAMDPLTGMALTLDETRKMTAELLEAHRKWIPAFENRRLEVKPVLVGCDVEATERHMDPATRKD